MQAFWYRIARRMVFISVRLTAALALNLEHADIKLASSDSTRFWLLLIGVVFAELKILRNDFETRLVAVSNSDAHDAANDACPPLVIFLLSFILLSTDFKDSDYVPINVYVHSEHSCQITQKRCIGWISTKHCVLLVRYLRICTIRIACLVPLCTSCVCHFSPSLHPDHSWVKTCSALLPSDLSIDSTQYCARLKQ